MLISDTVKSVHCDHNVIWRFLSSCMVKLMLLNKTSQYLFLGKCKEVEEKVEEIFVNFLKLFHLL